jgi:glucose-6-phosphate-specific signal transduction histidine kinase
MSLGRIREGGWLERLGAYRTLARGVLLFWAMYFTLVALTNALDAAKSFGALPAGWTLASGNYALMVKVTAVHGTPMAIVVILFLGVVVWEALSAALFWRALVARTRRAVYAAFTVSLALWAVFALVDEIFVAYALGGVHLRLFGVQLVSLLALRLLPDD